MFEFEQNVIQLLESHNIDIEYCKEEHYLRSNLLNIIFINKSSQQDFELFDKLSAKSSKTIRLWEDEYLKHRQIIDSRILSLLGISSRIYARETIVKSISQAELKNFLLTNHLNVPIAAKHRYGLFYKGSESEELVAVAAFSRYCPIQDEGITYKSHELIRYCSLLNTTVVGGLSKLISYFEQDKKPEHIMTYVDREWSDGNSYIKLGFRVTDKTAPQEFWLSPKDNKRLPAHRLPKNLSLSNLNDEGWTGINNLGNLKLVKFLK